MFTSRRIATMSGDKFRDEFSLEFDGGDEYIDCGDVLDQGTGNFSISVWFKLHSGIGQYDCFIAKRTSSGLNGLGWQMDIRGTDPWKIGFAYDDGPTTKTILGSTSIPKDTWNHYVIVIDRTGENKIIGYLNGVKDANVNAISSLNTISNNAPLSIGCKKVEDNSIHSNFVGKISEIAFYDTALTASQVKTLYNGREPYNHKEGIATGNLKAWWRMGDGTFDQKIDADAEGGIVCDMANATLGADIFGGKGDFSDASYWLLTTNQTVVEDGVAKWIAQGDPDNDYGQVAKYSILTSGQMYRIDFDVNSHDGVEGASGFALNFADPYIVIHRGSQTGHVTAYFKAANTNFRLYTASNYDVVAEIDNLVVRPVNGNAGAMDNFDTANTSFKGDAP